MDFKSFITKTAIDTAGTSVILADKLPPSVIEQTPVVDQFGQSLQAPVIGLVSSLIIQLALKGAKLLIDVIKKKVAPKPTL